MLVCVLRDIKEYNKGSTQSITIFCYRRVVEKSAYSLNGYSQYLCFNIIIGSNKLIPYKEYSKVQQQNYELIKELHESGLGYRRIAAHLNVIEIKTKKGNLWKHNNVYSVVKKYKEKQKRIILINKKYKIVIGKMKLEW